MLFRSRTAEHDVLIAERKRWLNCDSQKSSVLLPEGGALLDECIALASEWGTISSEQHAELATIETTRERCTRFGEMWEPDFLLLQPDTTGSFRLVAGCVCFPSSWNLAEKVGHPLDFIHGPVPGLNASLGRNIDSFLAKLAPATAWLRHNWGLSRSSEPNQHPSRMLPRLDSTVTLSEVWLRVEHQALFALPQSRGILFGIRVRMHSLAVLQGDQKIAQRLTRALRTMPEEVAAYKGLATARERITALLSQSF